MVKKYATQMTRRGPVQVAFDEQSVEAVKPQKRRPPPHIPMPALLADPEDEDVLQAEEEDAESEITMIDESEDESVEPVVDDARLRAVEAGLERLPNGNVLMIAFEVKSEAEALAAGRNYNLLSDGELWPDHIIEVRPNGTEGGDIVWEWHAWDHLIQDFDETKENYGVVADHPGRLDVNFVGNGRGAGGADWLHINSIDYNAELDQILLSAHNTSEIYVIDHNTTTEEAAGPAGDFLYRWGNPQAYGRGGPGEQELFVQHDARWIEDGKPGEGNILIFNNGGSSSGTYTTVDEIVPPYDGQGGYHLDDGAGFGPTEAVWRHGVLESERFYSRNISGAHRLTNGNTLICDGAHGTFFEIDKNKDVVWKYINPVLPNTILSQGDTIPTNQNGFANSVFRCHRYSPSFNGFFGNDLSPLSPIEINPSQVNCEIVNDIVYINKTNKQIIQIIDVIGRESHITGTQFLLYIYSDGTVEKRFVIQ